MIRLAAVRHALLTAAFALTLLKGGIAEAAVLNCEFQHRQPDDFFFRLMPSEIGGVISCPNEKLKLNVIYVASFEKLDRDTLIDWFMRYEQVATEGRDRTVITKESGKDISSKWLEIDTYRGEDRTSNFVFTARAKNGMYLAFVYTDTHERGLQLLQAINGLKKNFTRAEYVAGLAKALKPAPAPVKSATPSASAKPTPKRKP